MRFPFLFYSVAGGRAADDVAVAVHERAIDELSAIIRQHKVRACRHTRTTWAPQIVGLAVGLAADGWSGGWAGSGAGSWAGGGADGWSGGWADDGAGSWAGSWAGGLSGPQTTYASRHLTAEVSCRPGRDPKTNPPPLPNLRFQFWGVFFEVVVCEIHDYRELNLSTQGQPNPPQKTHTNLPALPQISTASSPDRNGPQNGPQNGPHFPISRYRPRAAWCETRCPCMGLSMHGAVTGLVTFLAFSHSLLISRSPSF